MWDDVSRPKSFSFVGNVFRQILSIVYAVPWHKYFSQSLRLLQAMRSFIGPLSRSLILLACHLARVSAVWRSAPTRTPSGLSLARLKDGAIPCQRSTPCRLSRIDPFGILLPSMIGAQSLARRRTPFLALATSRRSFENRTQGPHNSSPSPV